MKDISGRTSSAGGSFHRDPSHCSSRGDILILNCRRLEWSPIENGVGAKSDCDPAALLLVGADNGCSTPLSTGSCAALRTSSVGADDGSIDHPTMLPTPSLTGHCSGRSYSPPSLVSLGDCWGACRRPLTAGLCHSFCHSLCHSFCQSFRPAPGHSRLLRPNHRQGQS